MLDSNPIKQSFKSGAIQAKMKKMIRIHQGRIRISQGRIRIPIPNSSTDEGDSNPSREYSNPYSRECKLKNLKTMIRIPIEVIRIPIPVSLHEDQDSNPCSMDSNLDFRKGLNGCSMREIQIPIPNSAN